MEDLFIKISKCDNDFQIISNKELKFYADSFSYDDDRYFLWMGGVNLVFCSNDKNLNATFCITEYEKKGDQFFNVFRGSFCGALYDKRKEKWIVFNNHVGDQKLLYAITDNYLVISSNLFEITKFFKKEKYPYSLNINSAYQLLSYGYFVRNNTLVKEISRLTAGEYLTFQDNKLRVKRYYVIDNTPNYSLKDKECIEQIDTLFRNAIKLEYNKDLLYGFQHLASMSGGLDCRMNNFVAKDVGYNNITNLTFSQYGYLDMSLSQTMSSYLGNEWIFKSLDNGNFLSEIDFQVRNTSGLVQYAGSIHAYSAMKVLNYKNWGVLHSGMIGDVIISSFLSPDKTYAKTDFRKIKSSSTKLLHKVQQNISEEYPNNEIANLYVRAFNGAMTGSYITQLFTEITSPFLDVDFLNFCLSMPIEKRAYHRIYKKWIVKKYPDAAKFKWESINARITDRTLKINGKDIPIQKVPEFILKGIFYNIGKPLHANSKNNMNPFNYWYNNNEELRKFLQVYFDNHIDLVMNKELKDDCISLYAGNSFTEIAQVLTLLSAIKQIDF